jgi:hypothetical protein
MTGQNVDDKFERRLPGLQERLADTTIPTRICAARKSSNIHNAISALADNQD